VCGQRRTGFDARIAAHIITSHTCTWATPYLLFALQDSFRAAVTVCRTPSMKAANLSKCCVANWKDNQSTDEASNTWWGRCETSAQLSLSPEWNNKSPRDTKRKEQAMASAATANKWITIYHPQNKVKVCARAGLFEQQTKRKPMHLWVSAS
jgi:hypothetical protein